MELHQERMAPGSNVFRNQNLSLNGMPIDCLVGNSMLVEVDEASLWVWGRHLVERLRGKLLRRIDW